MPDTQKTKPENEAPEFEPMDDAHLLKLRDYFEENNPIISKIHANELYRACVGLGIDLPSKKQRATIAGRAEAMKRLRTHWAVKTRKHVCVRDEIHEVRKRVEIIQQEIQRELREFRRERGNEDD